MFSRLLSSKPNTDENTSRQLSRPSLAPLCFCSCDRFTVKTAVPSYIIRREFVLRVRTVIRVLLVDIRAADFQWCRFRISCVLFPKARVRTGILREASRLAASWVSHSLERRTLCEARWTQGWVLGSRRRAFAVTLHWTPRNLGALSGSQRQKMLI